MAGGGAAGASTGPRLALSASPGISGGPGDQRSSRARAGCNTGKPERLSAILRRISARTRRARSSPSGSLEEGPP